MTGQKNALATAAVGDEHSRILESTRAYFELFARRTGAEFVVIGDCRYQNGKYAKLAIGSLLEAYQRVLFVDADALILPGCPDLFADFRDPGPIYAWVEPVDWWRPEWKRDEGMQRCFVRDGLTHGWDRTYINTGVMLLSAQHRSLFERTDEKLWQEYPDTEQFYINYRIARLRMPVTDLGYRFNFNYDYFRQLGRDANPHIIHPMGHDTPTTLKLLAELKNEFPPAQC